jgi:phage portal protein BeeE
MDIFSIFKGSRRKSVDNSNGTWDVIVGPGNGADTVIERNLLANNKEWVFIAVDKVASSVSAVRLKVMKYARNGDDQEIFDGPLVQFLENPGPGFTGKDFVYLNTVYKELTGNAFWERLKNKSGVYPIIPTAVAPHIVAGKMTGYKVSDSGQQRTLKLEEVRKRFLDGTFPVFG